MEVAHVHVDGPVPVKEGKSPPMGQRQKQRLSAMIVLRYPNVDESATTFERAKPPVAHVLLKIITLEGKDGRHLVQRLSADEVYTGVDQPLRPGALFQKLRYGTVIQNLDSTVSPRIPHSLHGNDCPCVLLGGKGGLFHGTKVDVEIRVPVKDKHPVGRAPLKSLSNCPAG